MRELWLGDEEHCLDAAAHNVVKLRDRFFVVEIRRVAQAAQQESRADALAVMRGKVFESIHPHTGLIFKDLTQPFHTLFVREQVLFGTVDTHCHDDLIEEGQGPSHQVHMADGDRVERTGKDCEFFVHFVGRQVLSGSFAPTFTHHI